MYTCPMHPEVRRESPGRCPKCGMTLVLETAGDPKPVSVSAATSWRAYIPLLVIVALILATSAVVTLNDLARGTASIEGMVGHFMTGFFIVFAGFKLMDLKGFAEGYATYDLLARKVPAYAFLYPFIELAFGLSMLAGVRSSLLLWCEVGVMAFSGVGVLLKLLKKEKFQCVCLGTFLKIPLTKITVVEDFGMALLALVLLSLRQ
jgi:hypothetical protein